MKRAGWMSDPTWPPPLLTVSVLAPSDPLRSKVMKVLMMLSIAAPKLEEPLYH